MPGGGNGGGGVRTLSVRRDPDFEGLQRFPGVCGGIVDDYRRRCSFWLTDYTNGLVYWSKTLSAGLFMLFATLFSTIALGALVEKETEQRIGLSEYLLMNSVAGVAHVRRAAPGRARRQHRPRGRRAARRSRR